MIGDSALVVPPVWRHPGDDPALARIHAANRISAACAGAHGIVDAIRAAPSSGRPSCLLDLLIEQGVELRAAVLFELGLPLE